MVVPINVAHEGHGATSEFSESQILNSLEKMLNLYRERCSSQARQISMLKEQVHELTMSQKHWRGNPEYEPEVVQSPRRRYDQTYIDQLAKELQKMVEENARYRKLLSKAIKKLKKESEWRGAALAFLDSEHDVTRWITQAFAPSSLGTESMHGIYKKSATKNNNNVSYEKTLSDIAQEAKRHADTIKSAVQGFNRA